MSDYDISKAFEAIENELIDSMMSNFSRHRAEEDKEGYNWSQWQTEQLKSLEEYRKTNAEKFGKQFNSINGKVEEMIRTARTDGNAEQEVEILEAIKKGFTPNMPTEGSTAGFFKTNDRKLNALIKSTTNDLKSAETAVLRMSNDKYRKAIFNAQVYANTGAGTYEKAVDMACKDMLDAGLNCVEYKNGARHTLSDYADMAIKTANKRAYLRGEGEERAKYGLSLVVINSRRGGCPDCAKYIGKVFIDDVYSNGKQSDGNYPLLSTAIKEGLFHPRCKDSTSTYYPELEDLDEPLSEDEIAELDRQRGLEEQQKHAERQAKRFDRKAKYSLDEDNKRIAQARADEWHDRADRIEKISNTFDENIANSEKSDILKEESKKPITPITNKAIERVPKVDIEGYTEEQCVEIQKQHKELLEYSKNHNDNKEVAFVFRKNLKDRQIFTGSDDKLDFGSALNGMGKNLTILHNHPRNGSFSDVDISLFKNLKLLKTLTIVKNNGKVEFITKGKNFNDEIFKLEYNRLKNKMIKNNTNIEYEKFINKLLNKTKSGVVWSEKDIL